jgi:YggT family protein
MSESVKFWLFHGPNMALAAALYTLIGRYVLSLFFRHESELVIWRVFRQITDPLLHAARAVTPLVVPNGMVMIFAIIWILILRIFWLLVAALNGFLPSLGG